MWSSVKQLRDFRWRTLASGEYLMASTSSVIVSVRAHSSVIRCCVADHSGSSFNSTSQNFTSWSALPVAICREPEPPRSAGRASMAHTAPACASIASSIEEEPRSYSSSCPDFVPITTCDHFGFGQDFSWQSRLAWAVECVSNSDSMGDMYEGRQNRSCDDSLVCKEHLNHPYRGRTKQHTS